MAVRPIGGYDPNSDQPPDDSTGIQWDDNVNLPGQFQKGQGFRWGGAEIPPKGALPPPNAPARGVTLNTPPDIVPPGNSTIPPGKQVGPWTNPFTNAHINPATGQPEYVTPGQGISGTGGGGGFPNIGGLLKGPLPLAAGAALHTTPVETGELPRNLWPPTNTTPGTMQWPDSTTLPTGLPRMPMSAPASISASGGIGSDVNRPVMGAAGFPTTYAAPGQQPPPLASAPTSYPIAGNSGATPSVAYPMVGNTGATPTPAVAKQKPNLGAFTTIDAPNVDPLRRARLGNPQTTALDLSRLFRRQS